MGSPILQTNHWKKEREKQLSFLSTSGGVNLPAGFHPIFLPVCSSFKFAICTSFFVNRSGYYAQISTKSR